MDGWEDQDKGERPDECDGCGGSFPAGTLQKVDGQKVCDDCLKESGVDNAAQN